MGYTTDFEGEFKIDRPVDEETYDLLVGLNATRRMVRDEKVVGAQYGVEGEFYIEDDNKGVLDQNREPKTQPGLWNQWEIWDDRQTISWDGGEKFYHYVKWIKYIINKILIPKGHVVNGRVCYDGEEHGDQGCIIIVNNKVTLGI
jgi:hypothetical protein